MPVLEPTERASHSLASCCVLSIKPLATISYQRQEAWMLKMSRKKDLTSGEHKTVHLAADRHVGEFHQRQKLHHQMGSYKSVQILSMFGENGPQQRRMTSPINS